MGSHHRMADDSRRWDAEKREEVRRQAEMAKAARESTGTKHDHTQFTRNAEGEAQAQFRDEDFDFGGKSKQMLGSDGTIIDLEDSGPKEPAKVFKARDAGTVQRQVRPSACGPPCEDVVHVI